MTMNCIFKMGQRRRPYGRRCRRRWIWLRIGMMSQWTVAVDVTGDDGKGLRSRPAGWPQFGHFIGFGWGSCAGVDFAHLSIGL